MLPAFIVIIVWDGERITVSEASGPCRIGTQVGHLPAFTTCMIMEWTRQQLSIENGEAKRLLKLGQYRSAGTPFSFLICVCATDVTKDLVFN